MRLLQRIIKKLNKLSPKDSHIKYTGVIINVFLRRIAREINSITTIVRYQSWFSFVKKAIAMVKTTREQVITYHWTSSIKNATSLTHSNEWFAKN